MVEIDFNAPAGLYTYASARGRHLKGLTFRRFSTLAEAVRYAVEDLDLKHVRIETDERELEADEIRRAYRRADFPLKRQSRAMKAHT